MGYAIIKDTNSSKGYALNRQIQNVVPTDSTQWIYIPNTNSISFSYNTENVTDGIYRLSSLTGMSNYRQPYEYELVGTYSNVSVHPISGVITVQEGFTGNSVQVRIKAIYNLHENCYPPKDGYRDAVSTPVTISVSAPSHAPSQDVYANFAFSTIKYNDVAATVTTSTPTISYSYTVNGTSASDECTFNFSESYSYASVNADTGVVTFTSQNTSDTDRQCPVDVVAYYPNGTQAASQRIIAKQLARVLNNIAFSKYNSSSSIELGYGESLLASNITLTLQYNTGNVTVGPGTSDITVSTSRDGSYGSAISNVTSNGTVYIKYKDYTDKIVSKAYTVGSTTNTLTVTNNTGGYALINTELTADDFTVTDGNNNAVTSFTISPSTLTTKGLQDVTISDGNGNTGVLTMNAVSLDDFGIEEALLGVQSDGTIDNVTAFKGPNNSNVSPYEESNPRHLGLEFLQTAKGGDQYLVYFANINADKPDDNNRIMASTQSVLDFTNPSDPYTGQPSSASNNTPPGYISQQLNIDVNKLTLYTIPEVTNDPDLILTAFAHFAGSTSLTTFYALRVGGRARAYITGISETAYSTADLSASLTEPKVTIPLKVDVFNPNTNSETSTSFGAFLSNNNLLKEQYAAPVITYNSHASYANMPQQSPTSDGSLLFDFNTSDYMYDRTSVDSVNIICTSDKNHNFEQAISQEFEISKQYFDGYFNTNNFDIYELDNSEGTYNTQYFDGSGSSYTFGSGTKAVTVTALGEVGNTATTGRHLSNSSFNSGNELYISEDGQYYKLTSTETNKEFYIGFSGQSYGAVISKNGDLTLGTNNTSKNYAMNDANTKSKYMPVSTTNKFMIARHTTTFANTYLVKYGGWIGRWYLFIKK